MTKSRRIHEKARRMMASGNRSGAVDTIDERYGCGQRYAVWIVEIYSSFGTCDMDKLATDEDYFDEWLDKLDLSAYSRSNH